jgi:hypothetical protein
MEPITFAAARLNPQLKTKSPKMVASLYSHFLEQASPSFFPAHPASLFTG